MVREAAPPLAEVEDERVPEARPRSKSIARQYVEAVLIALLVAFVARSFVVQAYKIPSPSMVPTLLVGDYLLVNKLRYGLRVPFSRGWILRYGTPAPGDVIVFVPPTDTHQPFLARREFVKRVAAVAGEEVELRNKRLFVNGHERRLPGTFYAFGTHGSRRPRDVFGPVLVPAGHVFVLGDNRDNSQDSRHWGFVDLDDVEGKALLVHWSWNDLEQWVRWERIGTWIR